MAAARGACISDGSDVAECVRRQLDEHEAMRSVFGDERVVVHPTEGAALLESWLAALRPASVMPTTTTGCRDDGDGHQWPAVTSSKGTTVANGEHAAAGGGDAATTTPLGLDPHRNNSCSSERAVVAVVADPPPCELEFTVWLESHGGCVGCRFRCPHNYPSTAPPIVSVDVAAGGRGALSKAHETEFASALRAAAADGFVTPVEFVPSVHTNAHTHINSHTRTHTHTHTHTHHITHTHTHTPHHTTHTHTHTQTQTHTHTPLQIRCG